MRVAHQPRRYPEFILIKRFLFAILFLVSAASANAANYGDLWADPAEFGWGVFIEQSNTFQFLAFFIYGVDGKPMWYTAQLVDDGTGNYTGGLYLNTLGTYFGSPWQGTAGAQPVGTASFRPIDAFNATLSYSLINGPSVSKTIQRETLTSFSMSGSYSGSAAGATSNCASAADNNTALDARFNLTMAQSGDTSAILTFNFVDAPYNGMVCTLSGPISHYGALYTMPVAQYSCSGTGFSTGGIVSAAIDSFHQTGQGVEGHWSATTSTGCKQAIRFGTVLK